MPDTLDVLRVCWQTIKECYDLTSDLPAWNCILHNVDLSHPDEAAFTVLINLLTEAMECVDRFSPWYTAPAETFGLHQPLKKLATPFFGWQLTDEALRRWQSTLKMLARAIAEDSTLIDIQETTAHTGWLCRSLVPATCVCQPDAPVVMVPPHMLLEATLLCALCNQPLRRVQRLS